MIDALAAADPIRVACTAGALLLCLMLLASIGLTCLRERLR